MRGTAVFAIFIVGCGASEKAGPTSTAPVSFGGALAIDFSCADSPAHHAVTARLTTSVTERGSLISTIGPGDFCELKGTSVSGHIALATPEFCRLYGAPAIPGSTATDFCDVRNGTLTVSVNGVDLDVALSGTGTQGGFAESCACAISGKLSQ